MGAVPVTEVRAGDQLLRLSKHVCLSGCEQYGEARDGSAAFEVGTVWDSHPADDGQWYLRVGWFHHPTRGAEETFQAVSDQALLVPRIEKGVPAGP